ncbi:hypothetical protein ACO9S2_04915 [Nitrospira sp. NS4]|uniref:hypothetical protein n=1 Tax=Nitrospira sp. NS4 TaxID=3414498 RepID=UPI003C2BF270
MTALSVLTIGGLLATSWALAGCAEMGAAQVANQVGAPATAEDHLAAALMYEKQAQQLELEALKFEEETARITTYEDPKGFRRSALRIAAQRCRKEISELNDLAAKHREKAEKL